MFATGLQSSTLYIACDQRYCQHIATLGPWVRIAVIAARPDFGLVSHFPQTDCDK